MLRTDRYPGTFGYQDTAHTAPGPGPKMRFWRSRRTVIFYSMIFLYSVASKSKMILNVKMHRVRRKMLKVSEYSWINFFTFLFTKYLPITKLSIEGAVYYYSRSPDREIRNNSLLNLRDIYPLISELVKLWNFMDDKTCNEI